MFLTKEEKEQALETLKADLMGLSFSSVDQGYVDSKMLEVSSSVRSQIELVARNVSDLIYTHGNLTLQDAVTVIYRHGNDTLEAANRTITERTESILSDMEGEFDYTQDQINVIIGAIKNATVKNATVRAASIDKMTDCTAMKSLDEVAALDFKAHLTGCHQPANSYPVYGEILQKPGIVAYLEKGVDCLGIASHSNNGYTDTFEFKLAANGDCGVSEYQ